MHYPTTTLALLVTTWLSSVNAVTISLFRDTSDCSGAATYTCTDIQQEDCCNGLGMGDQYQCILFDSLTTEGIPAQGVVYTSGDEGPCGISCNAGYGLDLKLTCGGTLMGGGNWYQPQTGKARRAESERRCAEADIGWIDGRAFRIGQEVPRSIKARIVDLVEAGNASYSEVASDLRAYETEL